MTIHGESDIYFEWAEGTAYDGDEAFKCFDVITSLEFNQAYENSQSRGLNQMEASEAVQGPRRNILRLGVEFHSMDFLRLAMFKGGSTAKRVVGEDPTLIMGEFRKGGKYFDFANATVSNVTMNFSMNGPVTGSVEIHAVTAPNAATSGIGAGSHAPAVTSTPYAFGSVVYLEKNSVEKALRSAAFNLTNQVSESHAFNSSGSVDPTGIAIGGFEHALSIVLEDDGAVDFDAAEAHTTDTLILHCNAADSLTFANCAFTNPVLSNVDGIDVLNLDCPNSGVVVAAGAYDA